MPSNLGVTQPTDISYVPLAPSTETAQSSPEAVPSGLVGDMAGQCGQQVNVGQSGWQFAARASTTNHPGQVNFGNQQ